MWNEGTRTGVTRHFPLFIRYGQGIRILAFQAWLLHCLALNLRYHNTRSETSDEKTQAQRHVHSHRMVNGLSIDVAHAKSKIERYSIGIKFVYADSRLPCFTSFCWGC